GIWDWWVQTGELNVNERWAEMLGYTLKEIFPVSDSIWRGFCHPDDLAVVDTQFQKYLGKETNNCRADFRMRHRDGSWVWIQTQGKVFEWTGDGKPLRVSGTHLDITDRKRIELKLHDSEERFRSYFENSPLSLWEQDYTDVIFYLDDLSASGITEFRKYFDTHPEVVKKCVGMVNVIDVNQATLKLYDAQNKEDLFWNLESVFTEGAFKSFKDELISIYNNEPLPSRESTNKTLNGRVINIKLEVTPLSENRFLTTITDITESKNRELELRELISQTKADAETKEILLREINHRVKNNLSSFIGMLYAEKKQSGRELTEAQLAHVDSLINRVKGISIAHDLLSRSKWAPISLFSLSEKIVHSLNHLIPAGRSIRTEITNSSVFLDADQSHSMAVVINELFTNCIEHASHEGGEVEVKIKIIEKKGKITYIYSDTGPGFSKKVLNSESYNVGLYLINNIVEQSLRGTVRLKNRGGAMVIIDFPGGVEFEEL
ncbi:MAG: PAS domain-containing protein, partial [Spirochaetales bacterium]|nr:PAS domain-containing protein [Spirochaetales bacterium]